MFYEQPSYLEQKLLLKVLDCKFKPLGGALLDVVLDNTDNKEGVKGKFKNVCAYIQQPLTERLEETLSLLSISKREFLEMAIIQALDVADSIIHELDIMEFEREFDVVLQREGL